MASGRDAVSVFGGDQASVAVSSVAVGDVAGEREREGVPVDVVGPANDELADRCEVALDGVQIAGVGRGFTSAPVGAGTREARTSGMRAVDTDVIRRPRWCGRS